MQFTGATIFVIGLLTTLINAMPNPAPGSIDVRAPPICIPEDCRCNPHQPACE
ncbi:hypothetical protein IQ06DRAFT_353516 [Phaeosphaeriaceae sp. SRC1lsM3a]|nr:hypothetical protein IQ06DRAFT_353516 [Stagonospora sp. SRC1lsM3a]